MAIRRKKARPGARLQFGASLLAAARAVDTTTVSDRLRRFRDAHRSYVAAQRKVTAAHAALQAGQRRVATLRARRNDAVESLARALVMAGHPIRTPFRAFGAPPPSRIERLATATAAKAITRLVSAVLRRKPDGPAIAAAARAALGAVRALDDGLVAVARLEHALQMKCITRDAVGTTWNAAVRALRSGAIMAQDDGAPHLHPTLFPPARPRKARRRAASKRAQRGALR